MKKRILALLLAVMFIVGATSIPASAANTEDENFNIHIYYGTTNTSTGIPARVKKDYSASYVNYTTTKNGTDASGPYRFEAIIYGSDYETYGFVDCSSYTYNGIARTKAIITMGTVGLVRNDVAERFGVDSYGQIYGKMVDGGSTGYANGCWSVDSINYGYNYYNQTIG
ncbi:MAG: hypothetical protein E7564_09875 [Ruminococcaceae bacterium]|nr:hypothetical protein [Oscillospiraceae bacterium]